MFEKLFNKKKKKPGQLYFALVVADSPVDDLKFSSDNKDFKMFVVSGEVEKHDIIPRTVLKEVVDRFQKKEEPKKLDVKPQEEAEIKISEKKL